MNATKWGKLLHPADTSVAEAHIELDEKAPACNNFSKRLLRRDRVRYDQPARGQGVLGSLAGCSLVL